jgi:RNA recognition motif-containing protein
MTLKIKEVYNCGVIDAGLAVTKGRTSGTYITEFGLFSEKKLLTEFIADLADFKQEVKHTFDMSY